MRRLQSARNSADDAAVRVQPHGGADPELAERAVRDLRRAVGPEHPRGRYISTGVSCYIARAIYIRASVSLCIQRRFICVVMVSRT